MKDDEVMIKNKQVNGKMIQPKKNSEVNTMKESKNVINERIENKAITPQFLASLELLFSQKVFLAPSPASKKPAPASTPLSVTTQPSTPQLNKIKP